MDYRQVTVHPEAHIAPNATLVGKVDVAAGATVLFNATLRGDYGSRIAVGEGSNIQENACVHLDFDQDCLIGRGVTIGHGAVVHGCTLGDNVLVGMGAIVMNGARVGDNSLVAAGALVLFGAFPFQWEIGAVLVNTLNIVICAYCWYVIIAFTSFGSRDPYYYALGGWVVCFGLRSVARMMLHFIYPLTGNDLLITTLLGALVLLSAQVVLVQFLLAEHREGAVEAEEQEPVKK